MTKRDRLLILLAGAVAVQLEQEGRSCEADDLIDATTEAEAEMEAETAPARG